MASAATRKSKRCHCQERAPFTADGLWRPRTSRKQEVYYPTSIRMEVASMPTGRASRNDRFLGSQPKQTVVHPLYHRITRSVFGGRSFNIRADVFYVIRIGNAPYLPISGDGNCCSKGRIGLDNSSEKGRVRTPGPGKDRVVTWLAAVLECGVGCCQTCHRHAEG